MVGLACVVGLVACCRQRHQCDLSPVVGRLRSLASAVDRQREAGDAAVCTDHMGT